MRDEDRTNASLWSSIMDLSRPSISFPEEYVPNQEESKIFLSLTSAPYLIYAALVEIPKEKKETKHKKTET